MIKILHFIKLGDCNLNDQEIYLGRGAIPILR